MAEDIARPVAAEAEPAAETEPEPEAPAEGELPAEPAAEKPKRRSLRRKKDDS